MTAFSIGLTSCTLRTQQGVSSNKFNDNAFWSEYDFEIKKADLLYSLSVESDYYNPEFIEIKKQYHDQHSHLAKEYIIWREKNGSYYEDYDFYMFIFEKLKDAELFPYYKYEHTLAVAEEVMLENSDIILFAPAFDKRAFFKVLASLDYGTFNRTSFSEGKMRGAVLFSQKEFMVPEWCDVSLYSNIELDENGKAFFVSSKRVQHVDFTQYVYNFDNEKENIFELIAATPTGRRVLKGFLQRLKSDEVKILFAGITQNGEENNTIINAKWNVSSKIVTMNSKRTWMYSDNYWTYGAMAVVLFHEMIHAQIDTFKDKKYFELIEETASISEEIHDVENEIGITNELLLQGKDRSNNGQEKFLERKNELLKKKKILEKNMSEKMEQIVLHEESIAFGMQYDFTHELYKLAPCTLLYNRIEDLEGTKNSLEIKTRYKKLN